RPSPIIVTANFVPNAGALSLLAELRCERFFRHRSSARRGLNAPWWRSRMLRKGGSGTDARTPWGSHDERTTPRTDEWLGRTLGTRRRSPSFRGFGSDVAGYRSARRRALPHRLLERLPVLLWHRESAAGGVRSAPELLYAKRQHPV